MSVLLDRLVSAGCRVDGILFCADGSIQFATTNGGGAWTQDQQNAVLRTLGKLPPVLTQKQQEAHWADVIQRYLDTEAQDYGYDNLACAVSYATSTVSLWQRQAAAFLAWRDSVWQAAFALLAAIQGATAQLPANDAALIAQLPQPNIPTS